MAEIVEFVNRGAASITPSVVEKLLRHLPQWKLEFTQIYEPLFPHLVDQLDFLANAVEDAAEGAYKDLPYFAFAQAAFALIYSHKKVGIIPDSVLNLGRADDSSMAKHASFCRTFRFPPGGKIANPAHPPQTIAGGGIMQVKKLVPGVSLAAPAARQQLRFRIRAHAG